MAMLKAHMVEIVFNGSCFINLVIDYDACFESFFFIGFNSFPYVL